MKKTLFVAATALFLTVTAHSQIILNEVFAGGGSANAATPYTRDFVELYNSGVTPFSLAGYALQYASAAGAFTNTIVLFGAGSSIGGSDYLSVATGSPGTGGATLAAGTGAGNVTYLAPTNSASLSNTSGAIRLYNTATGTTVDVLGFGTLTNSTATDPKFEGTAAGSPANTTVSFNRTNFLDTNNNATDFTFGSPSPQGGTNSVVVAAPEPSTWAAMVGGLGLLALGMRRSRRAA